MTERYYPFDAGAGANITEDQWTNLARLWAPSGVSIGDLNNLSCFADSTGRQVKVNTGRANIEGHHYENDAIKTLAVAANATGLTRIDRVVLRLDKTANTITAIVITGTVAAPAITRSSTVYDVMIAQVSVANGAATLAAGTVTDEREYSSSHGLWTPYTPVWGSSGSPQPVLGNGSAVGRYCREGKTVHVRASVIIGSTSTGGTGFWSISVPFPWNSTANLQQILVAWIASAAVPHQGIFIPVGSSAGYILTDDDAPDTTALNYVTGGVPNSWAAGDYMHIHGTYEAA